MICNKKAYRELRKECEECPEKDACFNGNAVAVATLPICETAAAPILRETMQINIGGVMTTVYRDEIEKELYKTFREPFTLNYGA